MNYEPTEWTLEGFVDHFAFVHDTMGDHKYCWVLGAGASKSSGIPLGSELVDRWLNELYVRECSDKEKFQTVEAWATPENLGKDVFRQFKWEDRASFYPQIFQRRFREYPKEGFACLEDVMSGKDPSPGYSILAAALSGQVARKNNAPPHNVVITTNFDNLVGDALSIYTDTFPLICGHESLAGFATVSLNRPLICKIHRDLLYAPQNDPRSLKRLKDQWGIALTALFEHYTPLFIGYGGNDDTLMDLLESLEPGSIKGQLVWTYYYDEKRKDEDQRPGERIRHVVADHQGVLVPVPDFDLLMILLGEKVKVGLLDQEIERRSSRRLDQYRERVKRLDILKYEAVKTAFAAMSRRSGGWWSWEQVASAETDADRKEMIYREAIKHFPESDELCNNFAVFLKNVRAEYDDAEAFYQKALQLGPKDTDNLCNYAVFLTEVRGQHDEAEALFEKAFELGPDRAEIAGNYALFLWRIRQNYDKAEALFQLAHQLTPKNVNNTANYASFLWQVRENNEQAEEYFQKAIQLDPNDADWFGNYAALLICLGRLEDAAENLDRGRSLNEGKINQLAAELALYEGILASAISENDTPAIKELDKLFKAGFQRGRWSFDHVLEFARKKMSDEDYYLYRALADGILDESKVPDVEALLEGRGQRKEQVATGKRVAKRAAPRKRKKKTAEADS